MSRVCSAGSTTEPLPAMSRIVSDAGTALCAVTVKASSTTIADTIPRAIVRTTDRSASRPPSSVPTVMPTPNSSSARAPPGLPVAGHLDERRRDVAVDGEEAAEADRADEQGEQHLRAAQGGQLGAGAGARLGRDGGHEEGHRGDGEHADDGDGGVRAAPAELLAEHGRERHPDDVRHGEPSMTRATARARRSGGTSEAATIEATPKKAPCGRPLANRATTSQPKLGASDESEIADGEGRHEAAAGAPCGAPSHRRPRAAARPR